MGTGRRIEKVSPVPRLLVCGRCSLLAVIVAVLVQMCAAFNLDVENRSVFTGPKGSFFGYSVEFYQSSSSVSILIGAPKANTSQPHVTEGGSVFLCPWSRGQYDCNIINFDSKGERHFHVNNTDLPVEFKSHQWFGATVRSHGNTILACAPRYYWRTEHDVPFSDATGTCFLSVDDFRMFVEYAPCRTERHGPAGQGYCQGGFSADFTKDGKVVLGGPGSFYWQGQLISATTEEIVKAYYPSYFLLSVAGQIQTNQAQASYDDSYLGYSVAGGEFSGDSVEDFITGIPKGLMLYGLVSILDGKDLRSILNLTGEQMGSYFGYAVAATDIDNDGLMDLVVGAPMFMQSLYGRVEEVGKVYVYLQRGSLVPGDPPSLQGTQAFGRFGSSLAPLGDLDQDGFNDLAVGCPFGGEDHQGLVFIFNGHSSGLEATSTQTLSGQWASSTFPASFGFALRGNKDLDQNGYPDLIVGAFGVDKAVLYRGRPIVRASASLLVHPSMINPEERTCEVTKGNQTIFVACASLSFCISAQGKHLPADLGFVVEVQLDHLKLTQTGSEYRTLFLDSQQPSLLSNITVGNGGRMCHNTRIYLRGEEEFRDKLSPVDVSLRFGLDPEAPKDVHGLSPILHHHTAHIIQQKVQIQLDCGEDNICVPDLKLDVYSDRSEVYLEDENLLTLTINGRNEGEGGAYEAELYVTLPSEVDYSGIARSNASLAHLICRYDGVNNTRFLVCHLGNPMKSATSLWAGLRFTVPRLKDTLDRIHFELQIRSKNENNSHSEVVFVDLDVAVVADVIVQGVSHPDQLLFPPLTWKGRDSLLEEKDIGPEIQHVYELVNNGPSMINHSVLELRCPFRAQGHDLLYPVEVFTQGPLNCTSEHTLNMLKLKLQPPTTDQPPSSPSEHHIQRREIYMDLLSEHSNLSCSTVECWRLGCDVGLLRRGEGVIVTVRSRVWAETFIQRAQKSSVLECSIQYNVLTMPYSIVPRHPFSGTRKVVTSVVWNKLHSQDTVPLWIIILAVLAGLMLLSLLIYILYKVGFFKRSDPYGTAMEKAQLKPQASSEA